MGVGIGPGRKEKKVFFFEKKRQKNFDYVERGGARGEDSSIGALSDFLSAARLNMVFLVLFFKKEHSCLLLLGSEHGGWQTGNRQQALQQLVLARLAGGAAG
jgi:hypothetical protein